MYTIYNLKENNILSLKGSKMIYYTKYASRDLVNIYRTVFDFQRWLFWDTISE